MKAGLIAVLLVAGTETVLLDSSVVLAESCATSVVAVDTSLASSETGMGLRCGEAGGQTFLAADTLIRSIAIWRHAAQTPYGGHLKLWITEVDSGGVPLVDNKILDGPVITVPFGDGIHPIKMEWSFDPPFALPRKGMYFFAAQDWCGGHWGLLMSPPDVYPAGRAYRTGITCFDEGGCSLWRYPNPLISNDLVFTVEFCQTSTAVVPSSWGKLKVLYR